MDTKSKYYFAHNAGGRLIAGQKFEVTEVAAGTSFGVFEARTPELQAELDKIVANKSSAVEEISAEDYDLNVKKKAASLNNWPNSNASVPLQSALKEVVGVVVEEKPHTDPTEAQTLETLAGARGNLARIDLPLGGDEPVTTKKSKK